MKFGLCPDVHNKTSEREKKKKRREKEMLIDECEYYYVRSGQWTGGRYL